MTETDEVRAFFEALETYMTHTHDETIKCEFSRLAGQRLAARLEDLLQKEKELEEMKNERNDSVR